MVSSIPQEWKDTLSKIQQVFPGAVIAGGCLRDLDHGKPIKDVDIFVPIYSTTDGTLADIDTTLKSLFPPEIQDDLCSVAPVSLLVQNDYARCNLRDEVLTVYTINTLPFACDIIFVESDGKDAIFCTFDMSINMVQYDNDRLTYSPLYSHTKVTKIIKVINHDSPERLERRVARLQEKYMEYTIDRT